MNKDIPKEYFRHLETKSQPIFQSGDQYKLTPRGFWVGCFLSFFLAICAPYGDMILRSTYMALDISTPGAIFIFLCFIGLLNLLFKVAVQQTPVTNAVGLSFFMVHFSHLLLTHFRQAIPEGSLLNLKAHFRAQR